MPLKPTLLLLLLALIAPITFAKGTNYATDLYSREQLSQSFSACLDSFPGKDSTPVERSFNANMQPTKLCSDGFAVMYSKTSKTPLVVVERLNASIIADAKGEERTDDFYADPRLKQGERAELSDYKGSGFDRGHQAPAGDAVNPHAMAQTFALSNMIPQDPTNNRKVWSKIEGDTRKYASRAKGDVFVYTGPIYATNNVKTIGDNKVWVPTHIFKLVYDQSSGRSWSFILENNASATVGAPMSYQDFVKITGLRLIGN
jgi:endonuclease G